MSTYPDYVEKAKIKGTQIMQRGENYYLYKISSKWDKKKQVSKKITGEYLGKITPEGVVTPKHKRTVAELVVSAPTIKEFGASVLINHLSTRLQEQLQRAFPEDSHSIFVMSVLRFFYNLPIKNLNTRFSRSHLSDLFPTVNMDPKAVSSLLERVGTNRESMVLFMRELIDFTSKENIIVDLTHIFSESENINWLSIGHNAGDQFHKQLNMLLMFSKDRMKPVYFRLLPGAIRDVSSIKATIAESNVSNAIFVGDKGFHANGNVKIFEQEDLSYILPVKRNNADVNYDVMKLSDQKNFDGFFFFEKRHIWFKEGKSKEGRRMILFFDKRLEVEEENSFLERVDKLPKENKEGREQMMANFYEKQFELGTISVVTNADQEPKKIYECLKARTNVEVVFDAFKNVLEADKTYMQSETKIYGWLYVNFVSLLLYYSLYGILTSKDILSKYSPKDVVLHFSNVYKVKVLDKELISEIPKTTRELAQKMDIPDDLLRKM